VKQRIQTVCIVVSAAALTAWACDGGGRWESAPPPANPGAVTLVGCVSQTGQPDEFVFAVATARKAHAEAPPGTVVPQRSPLPPGSPSPRSEPPVGTVGPPGGGETPTTKIESYRLEGDGGLNLREHVGHTIEIVGDVKEPPEARRSSGEATGEMRDLRVRSATHIADHCKS
jgi:hypothetical protein